MLRAYTRDPAALFASATSSLAPASRNATQPVRYRGAVLAIDVGPLAAGARFHTVAVDWHKNTLAFFLDANDALNNVPCYSCGGEHLPDIPPCTAEQYVRETFQLLRRGHSLRHPQCACHSARARDLGVPDDSKHTKNFIHCTAGTRGEHRTLREVEWELGVRSLYGLIHAGGETQPLIQVLVRLAGFQLHADSISTPICCVPSNIQNADDIVLGARALYPRALVCADTRYGDLKRLAAQGAVRVLPLEGSAQSAVFWQPPEYDGVWKPVDADLRRMWHSSADTTKRRRHY